MYVSITVYKTLYLFVKDSNIITNLLLMHHMHKLKVIIYIVLYYN